MAAPTVDDYQEGRADALAGRQMRKRDPAMSEARRIAYGTGYHDAHGDDHYWMPPQRYTGKGPMEGEWFIEECWFCNAFSIPDQPGEPGSAFSSLITQLEHKGCDPQPVTPEGDH